MKSKNQFVAKKIDHFVDQKTAKKTASFLARAGCDLLSNLEDVQAECELEHLLNQTLSAPEIIAIVTKKAIQSRSKSAIATAFFDQDLKVGQEPIQVAAPEAEEIEKWRIVEDDQIEKLREGMQKKWQICDRRARQILQKTAEKLEDKTQPSLFDFCLGAQK